MFSLAVCQCVRGDLGAVHLLGSWRLTVFIYFYFFTSIRPVDRITHSLFIYRNTENKSPLQLPSERGVGIHAVDFADLRWLVSIIRTVNNALQPEHQPLTGWIGKPTNLATDSLVFLFISIDTQTHIQHFCKEIKELFMWSVIRWSFVERVRVRMKCCFYPLSKVVFIRLLSPVFIYLFIYSRAFWASMS